MSKILFTVGYGNRQPAELITLLKEHQIKFIVDVRAHPQNAWNLLYRHSQIKSWLREEGGIKYHWVEGLGNPQRAYPDDFEPTNDGIMELMEILAQEEGVCLLCSELDYNTCHRKTIVRLLRDVGVRHL